MNAIEVATLEEVTKDDETPAEPDQVDGLSAVASGGSPEAQKEMADWLTARLSVESIPVKVKTLRLITQLREKGGINFRQELSASATGTVKELVNFTADPDPVHGDKPAQLVRNFAEKALKILEMPAEANLVAQTQEGVGSRFSKTFGTLGKNITTAAAAAASAAAEAAHEAGEIATAKAEQARHEMERRQLEQQRAGRNMFSAAIAGGGSVADIVAKVDTTLAQERDAALANVAKLTAEVNSLQGGAMMQMHSTVLRENEALKTKVAALEAQVASLTQANQTAQAAVAAANAGGPVPAAAPVQEAVPPTADVDALLSGFGAPAAAPAPAAAAPAPAPATSAPAPATDADAAAPAPAPGPTRAELAAQARERARAQAKERAAAKKAEKEKEAAAATADNTP